MSLLTELLISHETENYKYAAPPALDHGGRPVVDFSYCLLRLESGK